MIKKISLLYFLQYMITFYARFNLVYVVHNIVENMLCFSFLIWF